jgi:uncharacterized protein (DUF1499 family)
MARTAAWSPRLAVFGIILVGLALAASRLSRLEPQAALAVFASGLIFAAAAALVAFFAFSEIWREGTSGAGRAALGLFTAAATLALPLALGVAAARLPPVADVSTNIADPPAFSRSAKALAARGASIPLDPGPAARQAARRAYPQLAPLVVDLEPDAAFRLVQKVVKQKRWRVIEERAPSGRLGLAQIDAVDKTLFFAFPVDLVIRLTPLVGQTRIDFRAAQRVGRHDLGDGARRWASLSDAIQTEIEAR